MKTTKLFMGDKRLKDIYVGATKWEVFKYRTAKLIKKVFVLSFIAGLVWSGFKIGNMTAEAKIVRAEVPVDVSESVMKEKIQALKQGVADQLAGCEGAGYKEDDGIIIFDTNNKASIGLYQWQIDSVIHYSKILNGKVLTRKEAVMLALDKKAAGDLALQVMFETKNMAGKDWVNCTNKLDLDKQIILIKKLER